MAESRKSVQTQPQPFSTLKKALKNNGNPRGIPSSWQELEGRALEVLSLPKPAVHQKKGMIAFMIDVYYLILVVPALLFSVWASFRVNSTFERYSRVANLRGLTAAQAARMILDENGLVHVPVEQVSGHLSDHYDPKANVIRLSASVYSSTSVGAIGVAAHECGHAVQYAKGYFPIKIRAALIPITNIGSNAAIPLAVIGLFLGFGWLVDLGILLFLAVVAFQLVTLPVEFNASRRAMETLEMQMYLNAEELAGARKVLSAAAMTYVAALVAAVANLLRLMALRNRNSR